MMVVSGLNTVISSKHTHVAFNFMHIKNQSIFSEFVSVNSTQLLHSISPNCFANTKFLIVHKILSTALSLEGKSHKTETH